MSEREDVFPEHTQRPAPSKSRVGEDDSGFYILSLKWTAGEFLTWWRPDNAGYTHDLRRAGVYAREVVEASPHYYDNGKETLAVPVASAQRWADHPVYIHHGANSIRSLRRARNHARKAHRAALQAETTEAAQVVS